MVDQEEILKNKFYLGALVLTIISLLLPWIKVPIVGGISAINNWKGLVGFFLLIGIVALFFYKKRYSYLASLTLVGGVTSYSIYALLKIVFTSVDLGIFGQFSPLLFVGVGLYLFVVGGICVTVKSFIELKKSKDKYFKFALIGAVVIFALLFVYMNAGSFGSEPESTTDLGLIQNKKEEPKKISTKEFSLGEKIQYGGIEFTPLTFEYDDTSKDEWSFESSGYILTLEIRNTNSEEIENCDFSFNYIGSDGEQIPGSGYYGGYSTIYPNAKDSFKVRFTTENNAGDVGTIYINPDSYSGDAVCPDFKVKLNI